MLPAPTDDLACVDLNQLQHAANWQAQFRLITGWGSLITRKPELRTDENKLQGCETAAWLAHTQVMGSYYFQFDSDSKIICGLAAIALSLVNGKTRAEVQQCELESLLQELGIRRHLTPSRSNGFRAILKRVRELAELPPA